MKRSSKKIKGRRTASTPLSFFVIVAGSSGEKDASGTMHGENTPLSLKKMVRRCGTLMENGGATMVAQLSCIPTGKKNISSRRGSKTAFNGARVVARSLLRLKKHGLDSTQRTSHTIKSDLFVYKTLKIVFFYKKNSSPSSLFSPSFFLSLLTPREREEHAVSGRWERHEAQRYEVYAMLQRSSVVDDNARKHHHASF